MISDNSTDSSSADPRGDRLYPHRTNRIYWHLTCLRKEIEAVIEERLPASRSGLLVDYGCGNMPYRLLFEPRLESYIGCDFPNNKRADRVLDDCLRLPVEDSVADYVLSTQVLEHVADPGLYLTECQRVLKEDGLLILSTHGVWRYHPDPSDFWRWTSEGLRKILTGSGFEIVRFRGIMGPGATALQLWQDAVLRRIHWRLEAPFSALMQCLMRFADRTCPDPVRDADACVYMTVSKRSKKLPGNS